VTFYLQVIYKSPGHAWSNADVIELLNFRPKSVLADNLNAKTLFEIARFQNLPAQRLL
jgi:hypothetical protein